MFDPDNRITFASGVVDGARLRQIVQHYFSAPYFSIDVVRACVHWTFDDFAAVCARADDGVRLGAFRLSHPGGASGYSIEADGKKIVYLCDNEYEDAQLADLKAFVDGADVVVWDGMFTGAELAERRGWGHSSIEQGLAFFDCGLCAHLVISHHLPDRSDAALDRLAPSLPVGVCFARDGMTLCL